MSLIDDVAKPAHYQLGEFQAIDVIEGVADTITPRGGIATLAGNVLKYAQRWPRKGGLKDLYKARWYLDRLIRRVEAETGGVPKAGTIEPSAGIRDAGEFTQPPNCTHHAAEAPMPPTVDFVVTPDNTSREFKVGDRVIAYDPRYGIGPRRGTIVSMVCDSLFRVLHDGDDYNMPLSYYAKELTHADAPYETLVGN